MCPGRPVAERPGRPHRLSPCQRPPLLMGRTRADSIRSHLPCCRLRLVGEASGSGMDRERSAPPDRPLPYGDQAVLRQVLGARTGLEVQAALRTQRPRGPRRAPRAPHPFALGAGTSGHPRALRVQAVRVRRGSRANCWYTLDAGGGPRDEIVLHFRRTRADYDVSHEYGRLVAAGADPDWLAQALPSQLPAA